MDVRYEIVSGEDGGTGSAFCPPGHPNHEYSIHGFCGRRREADSIGSLQGFAESDEEGPVAEEARRIMAAAELRCSEEWQRHVYSYFGGSYAPEEGVREVARAVRSGPPELHLGYLLVKSYFPDHEPRLDLIEAGTRYYGTRECLKCGKRVQYEGKIDGWMPFRGPRLCTDGRAHAVPAPPSE